MKPDKKLLHLKSFILSFLGLIALAQGTAPAGTFSSANANWEHNAISTKLSTGLHCFKAGDSAGRHIAIVRPSHCMTLASAVIGRLGQQQKNFAAAMTTANAVHVALNQIRLEPNRNDQHHFVKTDMNNRRQALTGGLS